MKLVIDIPEDYFEEIKNGIGWNNFRPYHLIVKGIRLCDELQEIRQEIESNIESIIDKYDSNTPIRNLASYKVERNEGRKECLAIIDKYIKQIEGSDKK